MCGIAGIQTTDGSPPAPALLERLRAALVHRGPDGSATLARGDTGLVHLRLAIVDLVTGDQPLTTPGGVALVANGEIYNDPDLRREMAATPFRTRSDCEPPAFLYERDGTRFADRLRGMYAIALHDPADGRLVLARDPFGIKPLYYAQTEAAFAFASEPQALLAAGFAARAIDATRRNELLQLKFTTGAETIFPGIFRVLPGETLVVERGRVVARHMRPALPAGPPLPIAHGQALTRLDSVLLDSVTAHLRADVPYGLFLSGGIDSAALLAMMRRATGSRIHCLTVGWEGAGVADESAEAERLARIAGADCERLVMTQTDFWRVAPQVAAGMDDPTTDAAVLPSYLLGQAARAAGLKVALCGEGSDELFGGYARYRKRRAPWRWLSRPPRTSGVFAADLPGWRDGIFRAEAAVGVGRSAVQAAQAVDVAEWLPNDLLGKLDRMLMVHGVEGRTPFLDPRVADFAFRLPDARRAGLRFGKVLLRDWLADAFPEAGAYARKKGFKPPVGAWIAEGGPRLAKLVARQPGVAAVIPEAEVLGVFAAAEASPQRAWSLLFYALWHRRHVLGHATPDATVDDALGDTAATERGCGRGRASQATNIRQEDPRQEDVRDLLVESDTVSMALYPELGRHPVGIEFLSAPFVRFFVARIDGQAVGCLALAMKEDGCAELKRMIVSSTYRRRGVGRALLEHAEAAAAGEEVHTVTLETGPLSQAAISLYRRLGYQERGPFGEYQAGPHSVFMEKRLTRSSFAA
jgi:asparagine synthase (glutamine-hydrolysing)